MSSRNRPKSNNRNGLTWNGGRPRGAAPGSVSAGNDELAAPAGRLSLPAGVGAAPASSWSGTVEAVSGPDVLLTAAAGAHVGRRVEVLAAADRATSFTPPTSGGQVAAG